MNKFKKTLAVLSAATMICGASAPALSSNVLLSMPVSAVSEDHVCMVTETEINDLLNAKSIDPIDNTTASRAATFKAEGGYNSNIYRLARIKYLDDYLNGNSDVLIPEKADPICYYTETNGQWCTFLRSSFTWGDNDVRLIISFEKGYLTIQQLVEKTKEVMAEVDEEVLDLEYFYSDIKNLSLIYFKTNSGEYLVPYHNKIWKDEYKGMAENGKIYPAKELADFLRRPLGETVAGVKDNKLQTSFVNPDGTVSIVDGEIDYDSMDFIDGYVILGDADRNGKLDVRDSSYIAKAVAGKTQIKLPDSADYNKDGKKNIRDAASISCHLAKK